MMIVKNNKGFTLPEVIVAIGIVVFGVVGGLTLINFALNSVQIARNRSVAVAALQEGMEIVRSMRDDNWHANRSWDEYISGRNLLGACGSVFSYTVDAVVYHGLSNPLNAQSVIDCSVSGLTSAGAALYVTPQGRFTHSSSGNVAAINDLRRLIQVIPSPPGCDGTPGNECTSIGVIGDVSFQSGSTVRTLRVADQLWDWR